MAVLPENVDADRVVISADHGEAFGEWGFYEHPVGCPHSVVKGVTWVEITAVDRGTRMPDSAPPTAVASVREEVVAALETQLRDLGSR